MRRMWLGREIVVAGLPPLHEQTTASLPLWGKECSSRNFDEKFLVARNN